MIDRREICRRHGLDERIAFDLHGETAAEMEADAAARAAIASMLRPQMLGEPVASPEGAAEPDTTSDFGGGVRTPAPSPSDPIAAHDRLISELLGAERHGSHDGFWEDGD